MAATILKKRFYKLVGSSPEEDTEVILDGQKVVVYSCGGNAAYDSSVKVEIVFGSEVIFVTHGDDKQEGINQEFTAEGDTDLKIRLVNDSDSDETVGGYYEAKKY